jgi:predicted nucleotidyltransferase
MMTRPCRSGQPCWSSTCRSRVAISAIASPILRLQMPEALRARAAGVTADLVSEFPQIMGVCLFGSVARGDAGPDSDLDLLVVGDDPQLTPSLIRRRLHLQQASPKVSIVYHTAETLDRYLTTGSRFLLHVQLEGDVLYDSSGVLRNLQDRPPLKAPVRAEVEGQLKRLSLYDDPARYNGNFLFPLSHIYAIGKAIVMAVLSENEIHEFNRDHAFTEFAAHFPDSRYDIETLRELRPFYTLVSKGIGQQLPFSHHDCKDEVAEAMAAARRVAEYVGNA